MGTRQHSFHHHLHHRQYALKLKKIWLKNWKNANFQVADPYAGQFQTFPSQATKIAPNPYFKKPQNQQQQGIFAVFSGCKKIKLSIFLRLRRGGLQLRSAEYSEKLETRRRRPAGETGIWR